MPFDMSKDDFDAVKIPKQERGVSIIKYVETNHRRFSEREFCPVDSLVLCQLFYVKIEETILDAVDLKSVLANPREYNIRDFWKLEHFNAMMTDGITDEQNRQLFSLATASRRFRDLPIHYIVSETTAADEKQFAACIYELTEDTDYLAFRGTDGSILGWKEDLNLSFLTNVPSQLEAVEYINSIYGPGGPREGRRLYIGGHSKGGNLAAFGAIMCDNSIKDNIIEVFCHDSPGFRDEVAEEFRYGHRLYDLKITKTVPQGSVIGMIMNNNDDYRIVKSKSVGILQHSAFTWEIKDRDFIYLEERSQGSNIADNTFREVLKNADEAQLSRFADALFIIMKNNNISSINELKNLGPLDYIKIVGDINQFDQETRNALNTMLKMFVTSAINSL